MFFHSLSDLELNLWSLTIAGNWLAAVVVGSVALFVGLTRSAALLSHHYSHLMRLNSGIKKYISARGEDEKLR